MIGCGTKMFRTIMALLVALLVAIMIGAFQILQLSVTEIQGILQDPNLTDALSYQGELLFAQLMLPYSFAVNNQIYGPLVALGVAGFISGLISKKEIRMLIVSIVAIALFFVGYAALAQSAALQVDVLATLAQTIAIDLGVAFGLLFIPGVIGARLTADRDY